MSMVKSDFHAALDNLENMAKAQGSTQLYHTPSDSDSGSHAGTSTTDYQNEHEDGIDENGTDYDGVRKALSAKVEKSQALTKAEVAIVKGQDPRPLIAEKVAKGESLTSAEAWVVKGGYDKMNKGGDKPGKAPAPGECDDANSVPDTNAGDNEDDEIEADAKKSLQGAISESKNLRKGIEMSAILAEFARAMGTALQGTEARVAQRVTKSVTAALAPVLSKVDALEARLTKSVDAQSAFNKGLGETVVGIGQHVVGSGEVASSQATAPVGAPKSQFRSQPQGSVQAVEKSFGPGGLENGTEALVKSQAVEAMTDLVKSNQINALEVCKFEMTGEISPHVQKMVLAHVQGRGQN